MIDQMKTLVKQIVRTASTVPGLGRLVRIAAAVYRLPEIREEVLALGSGHYPQGARPAQPPLWRALAELRENTVGDANLTRSVPVALRRLTREVHDLRQRLDGDGGIGQAPGDTPLLALRMLPAPASGAPLRLFLGDAHAAPAGHVAIAIGHGADAPLPPAAADAILVAYRLETFTPSALRQQVLPQLYACLKPGGRLQVMAADAGAALAAYACGGCSYEDLRQTLYGVQEREGTPRNMLAPDRLAALLREAGFRVAHTAPAGARDGRAFTFDATADKPVPNRPEH